VRGASRMLVVDRAKSEVKDSWFRDLPAELRAGDLLVLNDTRVIPARLYARRTTVRERQEATGLIEVLLTEPAVRRVARAGEAGKKWGGDRLAFASRRGLWSLRPMCWSAGSLGKAAGFKPVEDFFGCWSGSAHAAARIFDARMRVKIVRGTRRFLQRSGDRGCATAGLHFTEEMIGGWRRWCGDGAGNAARGVGTFAPLRVERVDEVKLHRERYAISAEAAEAVSRARREGRRIVRWGRRWCGHWRARRRGFARKDWQRGD